MEESPAVLFSEMVIPDDYIFKAAKAVHNIQGLFVLDCITSGSTWADMKELGIDAIISAPLRGWTGPACCALIMLSKEATKKMAESQKMLF
ncbi:hypothetical protein ACHAXS_003542 [Conticribra weissflogii]